MRNFIRRQWVRRHSFDGHTFVNRILAGVGHAPVSNAHYESLRSEITGDTLLAKQYEPYIPFFAQHSPHKKIVDWADRCRQASAQIDIFYVLTRIIRPTTVVETGVASGSITSFLLSALHRNEHGTLQSFDLIPKVGQYGMNWAVNEPSEVGFLIPEPYRARWTLTFEDASTALPRVLGDSSIDCFFHDSDHSYDHMMFEYAFAAKHCAPNGYIISDDTSMNEAFMRYFGARHPVFFHRASSNIGISIPRAR